jgi:hypothetical protein
MRALYDPCRLCGHLSQQILSAPARAHFFRFRHFRGEKVMMIATNTLARRFRTAAIRARRLTLAHQEENCLRRQQFFRHVD